MRAPIKVVSRVLPFALFSFILAGCGGGAEKSSPSATSASASKSEAAPDAEDVPSAAPSSGSGMAAPMAQKNSVTPRKIIYTAQVSLVVEKLNPAQQKLLVLVRKFNGYIAETNVGGETGSPRTGTWKVRVPVDGYQNFLDAVTKIGEVQTVSSNSEDVSEEFYDIQARLRNKRVEEKRLLEHLNRSTAKLSDILLVEKEISRVRGEIEQMDGRMRVLSNLTSLTTVTITINEIKDYVPPAPPTFGTQIARTFQGSFGGLINFGKGLVLLLAGLLPWLVVLLIVVLPLWKWTRKRYPSKTTLPPTTDN